MTGYESKKHMAQDKLNKAIEPHTTTFHNLNSDWVMPDWVMRITADRRIEVNEGVEVTEAAQNVLDALQNLLKPAQERNFCERCGKRTADLTTIHTCTPPQEKNNG